MQKACKAQEEKVILSLFFLKSIFLVLYLANQGVVDVFDGRAVQPRLLFQPGSRAEASGICSKVPTHALKSKYFLRLRLSPKGPTVEPAGKKAETEGDAPSSVSFRYSMAPLLTDLQPPPPPSPGEKLAPAHHSSLKQEERHSTRELNL